MLNIIHYQRNANQNHNEITHYQRNANQNHNEVSSHAGQNGCYQSLQTINIGESVEKREPSYTVGGNAN